MNLHTRVCIACLAHAAGLYAHLSGLLIDIRCEEFFRMTSDVMMRINSLRYNVKTSTNAVWWEHVLSHFPGNRFDSILVSFNAFKFLSACWTSLSR